MSSSEARKLLFRTENGDELGHISFDLKQPASELYALARKCLKDPSIEIALLTPTGDVIPEYGKDASYKSGATHILVEDHISVDRLMRHAYKKWDKLCQSTNAPAVFPVSSSITLLAALGNDHLFECSDSNDSKKLGNCTGMRLKSEDVDSMILNSFNGRSIKEMRGAGKLPDHILVLLDYDKTCDQEIASLLAGKLYDNGVNVTLLFTTSDDAHSETYAELSQGNECQCLNMLSLLESYNSGTDFLASVFDKSANNAIVQLAPVLPTNEEGLAIQFLARQLHRLRKRGGNFGYYVQKGNSDDWVTPMLHQFSTQTTIVNVDNRGVKCNTLSYLLGRGHDSVPRLVQQMWDSMIYVANPTRGREVAHYLTPSGRQYNLIKHVIDKVQTSFDDGSASFQGKMNSAMAKRVAHKYISYLMNSSPNPDLRLVAKDDGSTNAIGQPKAETIKNGYTYMLLALKHMFDVPIIYMEEKST